MEEEGEEGVLSMEPGRCLGELRRGSFLVNLPVEEEMEEAVRKTRRLGEGAELSLEASLILTGLLDSGKPEFPS